MKMAIRILIQKKKLKSGLLDDLRFSIFMGDSFIGGVGVSLEKDNKLDLGYWVGREYWGNGYATEAVMGLIQYIKEETDFKQITACLLKEITPQQMF